MNLYNPSLKTQRNYKGKISKFTIIVRGLNALLSKTDKSHKI